jgi:hypothetical protein
VAATLNNENDLFPMKSNRFLIITGLIVLAVLSRFLPHPPNFAPITAIALLGGTYFASKKMAFIIPIGIMLLSDAIIGFHGTMMYVYGAFLMIAGIGLLLRNKVSLLNVAGATLGGSMLFFIVTNFGVWLGSPMYPQTIGGLMECYAMAIPFFHYTIAGDVVYASVLFGAMEYAKRTIPGVVTA